MQTTVSAYVPDILGNDYEQRTLTLDDDYAGAVYATLVRKKAQQNTTKAVLYIHGFIDYFFQSEMAEQFNLQGYDFYALDLRKYGRSFRPHQKYYEVRDLAEYDTEIDWALSTISDEQHTELLLAGHSTGGLIATLYAAHHPEQPLIKALWCNSPFYDFNMPALKKRLILPRLSALGKYFPNLKCPSELNQFYVQSLHANYHGEWSFDLNWKKFNYPWVALGFVHAIYEAQKEIHAGLSLSIPSLIMHSDRTTNPRRFNEDARSSDIILSVNDIKKYAKRIQGDVSLLSIKGGLHDLVLSNPSVRTEVYDKLFIWLASQSH